MRRERVNYALAYAVALGFLMGIGVTARAADVIPPAPIPEPGPAQPPRATPETPSGPGAPAIPPSTIDPGIEHRPTTIPDPRSSVTPPDVDPNMTVPPETAPKKGQGTDLGRGAEPKSPQPSR